MRGPHGKMSLVDQEYKHGLDTQLALLVCPPWITCLW